MIAIIIIMILVITLGGVASYQIFTINQTQNLVIQSQKNQSSMVLWKNLLISKARAVGDSNEIVLPYGDDKVTFLGLPNWIYFNTKNAWGKEFVYCPFSPVSTGVLDTNVPLDASTNYQVRLKNDFTTKVDGAARDYVVASTYNGISEQIIAYILSPIPSATGESPKCTDVVFDSVLNVYKTDNALVEVITKGDVETYTNLSVLSSEDNGNSNGVTYINNIEGDTSVDGNTLNNNLSYIASSDFKYVYLKLPSLTSSIDSIDFNQGEDEFSEDQRTFILEGDMDGSTVITSAAVAVLSFNNYKVILKNIKLDNNISPIFYSSKLSTKNVSLANVILKDSEWKVKGTNDIVLASNNSSISPSSAITMVNSNLYIDSGKKLTVNEHSLNDYTIGLDNSKFFIEGGNLVVNKASSNNSIVLFNSLLQIKDSTLNVNSSSSYASDIFVDDFSKLFSTNSLIEVSGKASNSITSKGKTIFLDTILNTLTSGNMGIVSESNGSLILKANVNNITRIGSSTNKFMYAVVDNGGTYFGGQGDIATGGDTNGKVSLYGSSGCAYGYSFAISQETNSVSPFGSINDSTIVGIAPEALLFAKKLNASDWACNN